MNEVEIMFVTADDVSLRDSMGDLFLIKLEQHSSSKDQSPMESRLSAEGFLDWGAQHPKT